MVPGIEKLTLEELKALLSDLNLYQDMTKKLWVRGRDMFHALQENKSLYAVEYFPSLSEDEIYESAKEVFSKVFSATPKKEEIVFKKKESLGGGMRIYRNDEVVDMSFRRIEGLLKK